MEEFKDDCAAIFDGSGGVRPASPKAACVTAQIRAGDDGFQL